MHATTSFVALLAAAGSAVASNGFGLRAYSARNQDIVSWAVVNEHLGAGVNYLAVQRPTAYTPDKAHLNGTKEMKKDDVARLAFSLEGVDYPYEARISHPPAGSLVKVLTKPGDGTPAFGLGDDGQTAVDLLAYGNKLGWWICPETTYESVGEEFVLYYGRNPKKADLPDPKCQPVRLQADAL